MTQEEVTIWEAIKMCLLVINTFGSLIIVAVVLRHHHEVVRQLREKTADNILLKRELDELLKRKGQHCPD